MATAALERVFSPFAWTERNLGWRTEVAAIAILAVIVGSMAANAVFAANTSPASYAQSYVAARAAGDAARAWSDMQISGLPASDASLLTEPALAAMLQLPANREATANIAARTVSQSQRSATVDLTYRDGQANRKVRFGLVRSPSERRWLLYPRWRVAVAPAVIELARPAAGGDVSIDGLPVPASAKTVAVFPGTHHVVLGPSRLLQGDTETVTATARSVRVDFKSTLAPEAQTQAADAVRTALASCATATTLVPANCPQHVIDNIRGGATWQLFGDPVSNAVIGLTDATTVVVDSHYQMAVVYQGEYPDVPRHRAVAGTYEAALSWDGSAFSLRSIGQPATAVPELPRPDVADAAVLAVVKAAFDRCASATTTSPTDCPQYVSAIGQVANVAWHLDRDPVAGANVSFSGAQGMFRVVGSFSMTATYDETYQYQPTFHRSNQATGRYTADLFWDGQKPVFVSFE